MRDLNEVVMKVMAIDDDNIWYGAKKREQRDETRREEERASENSVLSTSRRTGDGKSV